MFPGVTIGFHTIEAAKNNCKGKNQSKQKGVVKAVFQVSNAYYMDFHHSAGNSHKHLCHRLMLRVKSYIAEEYQQGKFYNIYECEYVQKPHMTVSEW